MPSAVAQGALAFRLPPTTPRRQAVKSLVSGLTCQSSGRGDDRTGLWLILMGRAKPDFRSAVLDGLVC